VEFDRRTLQFLEELKGNGHDPIHRGTPEDARRLNHGLMATNGTGPPMHRIIDAAVPSTDGVSVSVRVLVPVPRPRSLVVYYHGGGWVSGSIAQVETIARKLAERSSSAFAVVEYRLAPENPYPAALQDCYAALEWVSGRVQEIAHADVPLIVAGDDAGGNLAALVALQARDAGGPAIAMQVLVCPLLEVPADSAEPSELDEFGWVGPATLKWYWDQYLPYSAVRHMPEAAPLHTADLSGLPPALIVTAEYSPARPGAEAYAQRLREAGVEVDTQMYERQLHGFFVLLRLPLGERAFQKVINAIRLRWARAAATPA
jgi:acetyl esterase